MNCVLNKMEQDELLVGYVCGGLDAATARTYEQHLAGCAECRELVQLQMSVEKTMVEWEAPEVSADFDGRLWARIRETEGAPAWWTRLGRWIGWPPAQYPWRWAMACAPAAALAIGLALWNPAGPGESAALVDANELREVERALDDLEALQALHASDPAPGEAL